MPTPTGLTRREAEDTMAYSEQCATELATRHERWYTSDKLAPTWDVRMEASRRAYLRVHYLARAAEELARDVHHAMTNPADWPGTKHIMSDCLDRIHKARAYAAATYERDRHYAAKQEEPPAALGYQVARARIQAGCAMRRRTWALGTYVSVLPYAGTGPRMVHIAGPDGQAHLWGPSSADAWANDWETYTP